MKNKFGILLYIGIFIALTCLYGYMWVLIKIYFYKIDYSIDVLNKDILLSVGMSITELTYNFVGFIGDSSEKTNFVATEIE